jgi:hypothetical protein
MVGLFELLSPLADSMGIQFGFIAVAARAISNAMSVRYGYAEVAVVFSFTATLLKISKILWDLATG